MAQAWAVGAWAVGAWNNASWEGCSGGAQAGSAAAKAILRRKRIAILLYSMCLLWVTH